jgi:hypothetical protein
MTKLRAKNEGTLGFIRKTEGGGYVYREDGYASSQNLRIRQRRVITSNFQCTGRYVSRAGIVGGSLAGRYGYLFLIDNKLSSSLVGI